MEVAEDEEVVEVASVEEETSFSEGNRTINQLILMVVYIGNVFCYRSHSYHHNMTFFSTLDIRVY